MYLHYYLGIYKIKKKEIKEEEGKERKIKSENKKLRAKLIFFCYQAHTILL